MKLKDFGCFFIQQDDGKVLTLMYFKINPVIKALPADKRVPNTVGVTIFDRGTDYPAAHPIPYKEFAKMLSEIPGKKYDYSDYTAATLHAKMVPAGIRKVYNKKWFEKEYEILGKLGADLKRMAATK
jgi:hypothetical protein